MSILKYVSCCCHDIYNGCFRVFCPMFLHRRAKIRIFTLIEFLMRKSCKSGISFRQQGRAGHCQSPDPASSFFLPLLNCSNVFLLLPSVFSVRDSYFAGWKYEFSPWSSSSSWLRSSQFLRQCCCLRLTKHGKKPIPSHVWITWNSWVRELQCTSMKVTICFHTRLTAIHP